MSTHEQSNNSNNASDTITVVDYLAEQERLEKCTYSLGNIRQTLYSCLTCNPNPGEEAGFCYACSISCHGDHQLVELFTKRSFRCDCGTDKFKNTACKLDPKPKGTLNPLNTYNHNYLGRFCWCDKQYDPMKEESTMLQCVVCEDWFHDECIGVNPHTDDFDDFICRSCTRSHSFLRKYALDPVFVIGLSAPDGISPQSASVIFNRKGGQEEVSIDVESSSTENGMKENSTPSEGKPASGEQGTSTAAARKHALEKDSANKEDRETQEHVKRPKTYSDPATVSSITPLNDTTSASEASQAPPAPKPREPCLLDDLNDAYPDREMSLFATEGWRDKLCRCKACMHTYTSTDKVPFILGEDPVYEDEDDDEDGASLLENGLKRLEKVDRVKVMDGMLAYTKFSDEIKSFLKPFSEQGKVVTAADISAFFTVLWEIVSEE
ncbi:putative E3 ubiquitin-protein ligase ubr7 [Actinomortierella ambigua]|nr:putative E3 ubiquitin-protein ligase ubr7 [Actinomortierella ambigua]